MVGGGGGGLPRRPSAAVKTRQSIKCQFRKSQPKSPCCHIAVSLYDIVEQHSLTVAYK